MLFAKLLLLLASFTFNEAPPEDVPYENPSDCRVRVVRGKRVYNSACG